jgi:hypothetical protein
MKKQKAVGSNQYENKYKSRVFGHFDKVLAILFFAYLMFLGVNFTKTYATGLATDHWLNSLEYGTGPTLYINALLAPTKGLTPEEEKTVDEMISDASNKYGATRYERNRLKALTHYLLLRENNYGATNECGDNGLACGPMQFHEDTYIRNRKTMIRLGHVSQMGSRWNMQDAIETAIYMFSIGQEKQWGPILRGEIEI